MSKNIYKFNKKNILFILLFIIIGFITLKISINQIAGSGVSFTLFDLFAPISGAFLGSPIGVTAVLIIKLINLLFGGITNIDKASIVRLFPILFAVWYFAFKPKKQNTYQSRLILAIPIFSMLMFNLHPIGRTVWFYSMFWFIPLLVWPLREKSLIAKSLGATFTAHGVGATIWIWLFNLPAAVWISLVPITAMERGIFALGISASYILVNNILAFLTSKKLIPQGIVIDKRFLLKKFVI
ncbi:hypothetical protein A2164_03930 [Candidatus Curtissbacteria bacterium RBG_13_35_7]|uniref:ECF transporter S component n=1 Tax=Candidatus Curtissbacteria bacterium RBG_13_35_7 TaxID=1797705 RepID=A0A1F5G2N3_9BACT|nr:MAG: hypothetical protein A2164_03930 [Candidatus Curtissbacteria bacterium RBG_13_35_7]